MYRDLLYLDVCGSILFMRSSFNVKDTMFFVPAGAGRRICGAVCSLSIFVGFVWICRVASAGL